MTLSKNELEAGAKAVEYELISLINSSGVPQYAVEQMKAATSKAERQRWIVLSNCALEAYLLHYRNLKQFLNNRSDGQRDDVKAVYYSDSWTSNSNIVGALDEDKRLNKLLAHISFSRENLPRNWDTPALKQQICNTFRKFLRQLDPENKPLFDECARVLSCRNVPTLVESVCCASLCLP